MLTAMCWSVPSFVTEFAQLDGDGHFEGKYPEAQVKAAPLPEPKLELETYLEAEVKAAPLPEPKLELELNPTRVPELTPEPEPELTPAQEKMHKKKLQLRLPISGREPEPDCSYEDFRISFAKTAGESLGVYTWSGRRSFCVLAVVRRGLIDRWNRANELTVLKSGAIVYEVINERGDRAMSGEAMTKLATAAQHVTIKARYYKKKLVFIENPTGSSLGIRLLGGTNVVEAIVDGVVRRQTGLEDEGSLVLPGDRITHINGEECAGETIVQMLRNLAGKITLTIRNAGCVLDL